MRVRGVGMPAAPIVEEGAEEQNDADSEQAVERSEERRVGKECRL